MSNFKDDDYVKEFICRTQMNYFMIQKLAGHNKNKEISCLKKLCLPMNLNIKNVMRLLN